MQYSVYILYSEKLKRHYIGSTDNVQLRLDEHNSTFFPNSFTSRGIPWEIKLVLNDLTSNTAYKIEQHIKNMKSAKYIEDMIRYPEMQEKLRKRYL